MRVLGIHEGLKETLFTSAGEVVQSSVFRRYRSGIELTIGAMGGRVYVSTLCRGLLPFSMIVDAGLFSLWRTLPEGATVRFGGAEKGPFCVGHEELERAVWFDLSLKRHVRVDRSYSPDPSWLKVLLRNYPGGLAPWDEVFSKSFRAGRILSLRIPMEDEVLRKGVRWFLGRGAGSTPAGDDMLAGAVGVWKMFTYDAERGSAARQRLTALESLRTELPHLTTLTSRRYIEAALDGQFGSDYLHLLQSLFCWDMDVDRRKWFFQKMLRHGASSGVDTCAGCVLALS